MGLTDKAEFPEQQSMLFYFKFYALRVAFMLMLIDQRHRSYTGSCAHGSASLVHAMSRP